MIIKQYNIFGSIDEVEFIDNEYKTKLKEMNYHNTTQEAKETLHLLTEKASKQDDIIKKFFKSNPEAEVIASEIWVNFFDVYNTPLTSVRRSLNTLKNSGVIKQVLEEDGTPKKKKCELYGRKVFIYKLAK